ncbi:hypothetical protein [Burkholderia lata]|uniref:hypothetical protein n=1 Tax=Burkholderia lata (strain ATCC 17760 / DSM 23089 / LMG 22485 / NCIMB 9086 / R18194 / 383) TaxID=482957 RepID=UPI00399996DF
MKPRQLIPDHEIIVILDTSPVRDLAFETIQPSWIKTFSQMARDGYSFSLADAAAAELLNQVRTGATALAAHQQAIEWISTFLNPEAPVLPGKMDLDGMIGLSEDWDVGEARYIAAIAWKMLRDPLKPDADGRPPFDLLLEEERNEWRLFFARLRHLSFVSGLDVSKSDPASVMEFLVDCVARGYDKDSGVSPPPSIRRHLELRYRIRQYIRTERTKEPYNPSAKKNRNDGIDIDLYHYLMLPAIIVAKDGGFYGSLNDIDSFQKAWFMPPERLAGEWLAGNQPHPEWPEVMVEDESED